MSSKPASPRVWTIDGDPFRVNDEESLSEELSAAITILSRVGGAVTIAANREEIAPGHYVTTSYVCRWNSFMPARRLEAVPDPVVNDDDGPGVGDAA